MLMVASTPMTPSTWRMDAANAVLSQAAQRHAGYRETICKKDVYRTRSRASRRTSTDLKFKSSRKRGREGGRPSGVRTSHRCRTTATMTGPSISRKEKSRSWSKRPKKTRSSNASRIPPAAASHRGRGIAGSQADTQVSAAPDKGSRVAGETGNEIEQSSSKLQKLQGTKGASQAGIPEVPVQEQEDEHSGPVYQPKQEATSSKYKPKAQAAADKNKQQQEGRYSIISNNIATLVPKLEQVLGWNADVLAFQETRLSSLTQLKIAAKMHDDGCSQRQSRLSCKTWSADQKSTARCGHGDPKGSGQVGGDLARYRQGR